MENKTEYQRLAELFADDLSVQQGKMFGSPCLKVNGKVFMIHHEEFMVFKLPPGAHATAIMLEGAERANPSGKRVLREWVTVPTRHAAQFRALAHAAAEFVRREA